jgi:charged multivesicular body protein 7
MKNYESSAATLKAILAHPSLQRERVDDTMDALASANADAREIDDAIRIGGQMNIDETGAIDEDEIERELAQLAEEGKRQQETEAAAKLPLAPVTPPQRKETPRLESSQGRLPEAA